MRLMSQNSHVSNTFMVIRKLKGRRAAPRGNLPYITEEGLVLIDRRENGERRSEQRQHQV